SLVFDSSAHEQHRSTLEVGELPARARRLPVEGVVEVVMEPAALALEALATELRLEAVHLDRRVVAHQREQDGQVARVVALDEAIQELARGSGPPRRRRRRGPQAPPAPAAPRTGG